MFHVGETHLYTNTSHTSYVQVEDTSLDSDVVLHFLVKTTKGKVIEMTKELLEIYKSDKTFFSKTIWYKMLKILGHLLHL